MIRLLAWSCLLGAAVAAAGDPSLRVVEYRDGGLPLQGCAAADPDARNKLPGLLLLDESGANAPIAQRRAVYWAKQGYVVFSADLFGKGVQPKDPSAAAAKAGPRAGWAKRVEAGLAQLCGLPNVDPARLAIVGYGQGGTAALDFARGGAEVAGVVCLHGDLSGGDLAKAKQIRAELFVICGTEDPRGSTAAVEAFDAEMKAGGVNWQELFLGGACAGFTHPGAGRNPASGQAFDPIADRKAQEAARSFLVELFPREATSAVPASSRPASPKKEPAKLTLPTGVPAKVGEVLAYVDEHKEAPEGFVGGRSFLNIEGHLPKKDKQGRPVRYQEWDVNEHVPGRNRGAERLVTGSDGSAHYTSDHYRTFKRIR